MTGWKRAEWNADWREWEGKTEEKTASGPKTSGLNQPHLIASGREFTALITLNHDTASRFNPDNPGANPTQSRGLQNFDHITGLKIQLHARNKETTKWGASNAPWRT